MQSSIIKPGPNADFSAHTDDKTVPAEIFLDAEQAEHRRASLKYAGNVHTIPRLRLLGFTLLALLGVPLHNAVITHTFSFNAFFTYFTVAELYATTSWLILYAYYDKVGPVDLGDVFLYLDLVFWAGAVYVTGGEKSWFFWLPLLRVSDQSMHGFRRCFSFVLASTGVFVTLWLYLLLVEHRQLDISSEIAKTIFVGVAGFYIALTSQASERVRSKLVSTVRFARGAIAQLKERSDQLAESRLVAERASQAKSEFLARVSHELRRPTTTVIGFAQLLDMGELTLKQRDYVSRIMRGGQDLAVMIDEVMDLADLQSGLLTIKPQEIRLSEMVEETLAHVWPLAAARGVRLISTEDSGTDSVLVWADPRGLRRVIINTVSHVIRYSGSEDRVVVSWDKHGDVARIAVRDSGPGILSEPVEEILSSTPNPEEEITRMHELGLGLAFAKALVVAMQGRVGADLEVGEGTTYWIEMPTPVRTAEESALAPMAGRA